MLPCQTMIPACSCRCQWSQTWVCCLVLTVSRARCELECTNTSPRAFRGNSSPTRSFGPSACPQPLTSPWLARGTSATPKRAFSSANSCATRVSVARQRTAVEGATRLTIPLVSFRLCRRFGKNDPYCVIRCGSYTCKTRVINNGGRSATWNFKVRAERADASLTNR